jgi:hypothetical protein
LNKKIARRFVNCRTLKIAFADATSCSRQTHRALSAARLAGESTLANLREKMMRKITLTALGSALIALSMANAAVAAERHHARRSAQQPTLGTRADVRDSYAEFAPAYRAYDARVWGGAMSAPAGH